MIRTVAFVAGGVALVVLGVVLWHDTSVSAMVGTVAFGVVCVAGGFMLHPPRDTEIAARVGSVSRRGRTDAGLVVTFSVRRMVLAVLGSLAFTVASVTMVLDGEVVLGALCTVVFAAFTVLGAAGLVGGPTRLVFTSDALVQTAGLGRAAVRWEDVEEVAILDVGGTEFLRVAGRNGVELDGGILSRLNRVTRRGAVEVPVGVSGVPGPWLEELVLRCVDDPAARARVASGDYAARA